ncbi:MAG: hypothetical protein ABWY83_06975 [Actinomycetota bacterium]
MRIMQRRRSESAVLVVGVLLVLAACDGGNTPADQSQAATTPQANAEEVAARFVEAFAAFDAGGAIEFLSDDTIISELVGSEGTQGVEGSLDELRVFISLLEAQRYQQLLDACEETGSSPSGNTVSCGFDYHLFGSDDVGLGPYTGSSFGLTVRDGEIVRASLTWGTDEFSPQMWEPFAAWISDAYPRDAALMYGDETHTGVRLTEESVALWGQHIPEYVAQAST